VWVPFCLTCHCPGPIPQRVRGWDLTSYVAFLGPRLGHPKIIMTSAPLGMGVALFSPGSPSSLLPLVGAPDVRNFFIMVQSLRLCLTGYW
jgi:hypothetical protein